MSAPNDDGSDEERIERWLITRRRFLHLSLGAAGARWLTLPRGLAGRLTRGSYVNASALSASGLPMLLQSPFLAMAALGDNTRPDPQDRGNHLRWGFQPELGFPDGGFDLYRRLHIPPRSHCILSWPKKGGQNLGRHVVLDEVLITCDQDLRTIDLVPPTGSAEIDLRNVPPVTIVFGEPCRYVELHVAELSEARGGGSGTIRATAYDGAVPVAGVTSTNQSGEQNIKLHADRIDHVVLAGTREGPMRAALLSVCYATVADSLCALNTAEARDLTPTQRPPPENASAEYARASVDNAPNCLAGWTKLNIDPICLPLGDTSYPCHLSSVGLAESAEAQRRIKPQPWAATYGPEFTSLRDVLAQIYHPPAVAITAAIDNCPPGDTVAGDPPEMAYDPLAIVLVAALEPDIARIEGLYWIDGPFFPAAQLQVPVPGPAAPGVPYDYLIVGHFAPRTQVADVTSRWNSLGQIVLGTVQRGTLTYQTTLPLTVKLNATTGTDFNAPLALRIVDNVGQPLVITLNAKAEAIELALDVPAGAFAIAHAYAADGTPLDAAHSSNTPAGATRLLLLAEGIARVELEGRGIYLGLTEVFQIFEPGGSMGYLVHDVVLGTPAPLAAPAMLDATPLPVLTHAAPDGAGGCIDFQGQMAAGLRWDANLPPSGILPQGAVWYDIERQALGSGVGASPLSPNNWQTIRNHVIVALAPDSCDSYLAPPGWPAQPPHVVDQPPGVQERWYAYRVRGRDIFGRVSAWTLRTPVDLRDVVPPPPPANVTARYLDPDDPYLAPEELVWTANRGQPRHGLRIGWRWWDNLRSQAPDAAQFRVYLKRGRANVVIGFITQVNASVSPGLVALHTDVPITSYTGAGHGHQPNDFSGELLDAGGTLYPIVESDVDGNGFLTLRYEPLDITPPSITGVTVQVADPRPLPSPGPFSLSIRPPMPLAGRVTARVIQGTAPGQAILLETDVRHRGVVNDLAGFRFVSAGVTWTVIGNTTGWNFVLRLQLRDCEPYLPDAGTRFRLMAANGVTPVLLDPGNRHWLDMGDRAHWTERLHVEQGVDVPTGSVASVVDSQDGTLAVTLNVTGGTYKQHYLGGVLQIGDSFWPVVGRVAGAGVKLRVPRMRRNPTTGVVDAVDPPGSGNPDFTYWPDIALPISLPLDPREGTAIACVAVSTADNKAYGLDPWPTGTEQGNEGPLSAPVVVMRVDRTEPPAPGIPANAPLVATPADFHGDSFFHVRWLNGGNPDMRVLVYRTLADLVAGNFVEPVLAPGTSPDLDRYMLVTPKPLRSGDHADVTEMGYTASPGVSAWRDRLDGKSRSRYFYRVLELSTTGVYGRWSAAVGPVRCPSVVPPAAPVVTKVLGGDRAITIRWVKDPSPDVYEYRVHRATDKELATQLWLMTHVATLPALGANAADVEIVWKDQPVHGLVPYYYRVVTVDSAGNVSQPSAVVVGQAHDQKPPDPPVWVSAAWKADGSGIELAWVGEAGLEVLVQRRDGPLWRPLTGWMVVGTQTATDASARSENDNRYRLRVRSSAGNVNVAYNDIVVAHP